MKILVDTCIWSLAFRRKNKKENRYVEELKELIKEARVQLIGTIRQEILSGIRSEKQFETLKNHLAVFPDLDLESKDYELAAEYYNRTRMHGIQGSNTDFLICAVSFHHNMPIFTTDADFRNFSRYIPIKLYKPRTGSTEIKQ